MLDRLTGMQVYAKAAALGSLAGAARALNMSQTMATKHIAAIEAKLGVKLLHRTTRKLTLTEPGRRYLESVERILAEIAEAEAAAAAERVEVAGVLRLNVPVSFGVREVAPLIAEFSRLHPAVAVDMGLNDRVVDLVEEGWDVAVRIGRIRDQNLVARKLARCRTLLAASPQYLAARGTPRKVEDLAGHNCLGYTLSNDLGPRQWAFGRDGAVKVSVSGAFQASNGDALAAAAMAGHGVVYQPTFLVGEDIRAGRLVALALDHPPVELPGVFAVYAGNRRPPPKSEPSSISSRASSAPIPPGTAASASRPEPNGPPDRIGLAAKAGAPPAKGERCL